MKTREILGALCLLIVLMGAVMQWLENIEVPSAAEPVISDDVQLSEPAPSPAVTVPDTEEAHLLLVNAWNPVEEVPADALVYLPNGQQVAEACYEDLTAMLTDCTAAGGRPEVCSGYRTYAMQEQLYRNKVERVMAEGYGEDEAEDIAACSVAVPGTSEHHTGLAVDIVDKEYPMLNETQAERFTQQWLMEHCGEYGFILRYPKDKSHATGIIYEPWHYRYVGREMALFLQERALCLEELYTEFLQA